VEVECYFWEVDWAFSDALKTRRKFSKVAFEREKVKGVVIIVLFVG